MHTHTDTFKAACMWEIHIIIWKFSKQESIVTALKVWCTYFIHNTEYSLPVVVLREM
jgi:hypothetical protein